MGAFRGYFSLNGAELANSSRAVAHIGLQVPTSDTGLLTGYSPDDYPIEDPRGSRLYLPFADGPDSDGLYAVPEGWSPDSDGLYEINLPCGLDRVPGYTTFFTPSASMVKVSEGLYTPPDGARRFGPGILVLDGSCWDSQTQGCQGCRDLVGYDDSWTGLMEFLDEPFYRIELAPWYTTELPESAEFLGVWVMKVDGFGPAPIQRDVTELVGSGGVAGPARDKARVLRFEALLLGCTNAGVEFGLDWLACLLRDTNSDTSSVLRYLNASPTGSNVDPDLLARELHQVVLTEGPLVEETLSVGSASKRNRQGSVYRVSWTMTALHPYAYLPAVTFPVEWDEVARQPINWVHASDCEAPATCEAMPVLWSTECVPEEIDEVRTPPPVCGGCLPVGAIDKYAWRVPTMDWAFRCRETVVGLRIRNLSAAPLTLQAFWRVCGTDVRCEDNRWPLQVAGLPPGTELILDGISNRYWAIYDGRVHRPVGIVGTPNGAPWRPAIIDRQTCWDFIVQTASSSEFEVTMTLCDREP